MNLNSPNYELLIGESISPNSLSFDDFSHNFLFNTAEVVIHER